MSKGISSVYWSVWRTKHRAQSTEHRGTFVDRSKFQNFYTKVNRMGTWPIFSFLETVGRRESGGVAARKPVALRKPRLLLPAFDFTEQLRAFVLVSCFVERVHRNRVVVDPHLHISNTLVFSNILLSAMIGKRSSLRISGSSVAKCGSSVDMACKHQIW